jgi:hypothetical protein
LLDWLLRTKAYLKKPSIDISPYSFTGTCRRDRTDSKTTNFIFALPLKDGEIFEFPFQIDIHNTGQKSAESVEVFIRTHKVLLYGGLLDITWHSPGPKQTSASKVSESGSLMTLYVQLDNIHPNQIIYLNGAFK